MNIRKYLLTLKRKLFAIREYDERLQRIEARLAAADAHIRTLTGSAQHHTHQLALIATRTPRPAGKLRCLFVVNNLNAWHALDGLVRRLLSDGDVDVTVVSANKRFPGQDTYSGEPDVHKFLAREGIPHLRLGMQDSWQALEIIMSLAPDVIFRQSQWDADYPPGLSSESLCFTRLAIVPYGICNIVENVLFDGDIKNSAVDSPFHRRCWRAYCASEGMLDIARRDGVLQGRQFRVVGHPKVDYLLSVSPRWPFSESPRRHRVLWSPHHSITRGWTDFGLFPSIWRRMLAVAEKLKTVEFVFCPHPALMTQLEGPRSPVNEEDLAEFKARWAARPGCYDYYGAGYAAVAAASDLIITDGISMLMEGQLLGKPIIFTGRDGHASFNSIGNGLRTGFHTINGADGLEDMIVAILSGELSGLAEEQADNVSRLFPVRDAVTNIVADLKTLKA